MALAYFDCFAGSGGDMIVAALIDAGAGLDGIRAEIAKLGLGTVELTARRVHRGGLTGLHFQVRQQQNGEEHCHDAAQPPHHRHLAEILEMIARAGLAGRAGRAAERAARIFTRLGEAEAKVHNIAVEEVHFHEVGAVDSIVDVVAACVALELLDVDRVISSPIPLGSGTVRCEHGVLPVPAPATAELVRGAATCPGESGQSGGGGGELTTPTAAAILTTLAESYGPIPAMSVASIGYGAGTRDGGPVPNLLRVFLGQPDPDGQADTVVELTANIDDCPGEILGAAMQRLLAAGCLDAWAVPIVMKKSRPAWMLSALVHPGDVTEAERILFAETTTFGIRRRVCQRSKLQRHWETVETPYGPIRVKVGRREGRTIIAAPEFDECAQAAERHGTSVRDVQAAAQAAYRDRARHEGG